MSVAAIRNSDAKKSQGEVLLFLQYMRGLAAIAVAIYHTHLILKRPVYGAIDVFGAVSSRGWIGVNLFFVISGFIILYVHASHIGRPQMVGRYLWRRISRIYPLYWLVLTAYLIAAAVGIGYSSFSWDAGSILTSYMLVHLGALPDLPLQVAWTLVYEVMFYASFALLMVSRKLGVALYVIWLLAIAYNALIVGDFINPWLQVWNLYFFMGAAGYALFLRVHSYRIGGALFGAGAIVIATLLLSGTVADGLAAGQKMVGVQLGLALGFASLLTGAAILERGWVLKSSACALLVGNASFATYLVHSPVISVMAQINHRYFFGALPDEWVFAIIAMTSVAAGVVAHVIVEQPLLRFMRSISAR